MKHRYVLCMRVRMISYERTDGYLYDGTDG